MNKGRVVVLEMRSGYIQSDLTEYINDTILSKYGLVTYENVEPVKGGYKIKTGEGFKFLRRAKVKKEELILAEDAINYLIKQGYKNVLPLIKSQNGDPFVSVHEQFYYLTNWVKGRQLQLGRWSHLQDAVITLARMQIAIQGYKAPIVLSRERWGEWRNILYDEWEELEKCFRIINSRIYLSECDILFKSVADQISEQALYALNFVNNYTNDKLIDQAKKDGILCHDSFGGRNLIRTNRSEIYVVNFDNCVLDIRVVDFAKLLSKVLPRYYWDWEITMQLFELYTRYIQLSEGELQAVAAYLTFPHHFWGLARGYYLEINNGLYQNFVRVLERAIVELPLHQEFIRQLISFYKLI